MSTFRKDIETVVNSHSKESGSNTPDWILANYLVSCLEVFDEAVRCRERWHDREDVPHFETATRETVT